MHFFLKNGIINYSLNGCFRKLVVYFFARGNSLASWLGEIGAEGAQREKCLQKNGGLFLSLSFILFFHSANISLAQWKFWPSVRHTDPGSPKFYLIRRNFRAPSDFEISKTWYGNTNKKTGGRFCENLSHIKKFSTNFHAISCKLRFCAKMRENFYK